MRVLLRTGAVLVVAFAGTGLLLRHTTTFGFDLEHVTVPWIVRWYAAKAPTDHRAFSVDGIRWTQLGDRTFRDGDALVHRIGRLQGAVAIDELTFLADDATLWALDTRLGVRHLLPAPAPILELYRSVDGRPGIDTQRGAFVAATGFDGWSERERDRADTPAVAVELSAAELDRLRARYMAELVTTEQFIADLHTGRLFGAAGPWLIDLAAMTMLAAAIVTLTRRS